MKYLGLMFTSLKWFWQITALECGGPDIWSDQSALSAMVGSTEIRCGQLSLTRHRLSCTVLTEEDERNLMCGERQQSSNCNVPIRLCDDSSPTRLASLWRTVTHYITCVFVILIR